MASPRMAPLLAQLDTSLELALGRMRGLDDDEYWWLPEPGAATLVPDARGALRPMPLPDDSPRTRTIALLTGHLGEIAILRADYTTGERRLAREDVEWPATVVDGLEFLRHGWALWRAALSSLEDSELDVVGRSAMPWGLDPTLPILDIAWWMNRELIHHTAEIAFVRDLYARRAH
jgi:DinB superfamily